MDNNKSVFDELIITMLKNNSLYDDNNDIFRIDETLSYDRYIDIYKQEKILNNIKTFNNNFESLGGRIYLKNDPIVKSLDIHSNLINYNDKYIYMIPNYLRDYDYLNNIINNKFKKLKNNKNILVIASPIRANSLNYDKELNLLDEISHNYNYSYSKVIVINLDKIIYFDLLNNNYNLIKNNI